MTNEELKQLIESDPQALSLMQEGKDFECAERCSEIAPPGNRRLQLSRIGLVGLFADPSIGAAVVKKIKDLAVVNQIAEILNEGIDPKADVQNLPDFSLPAIRAALKVPVESGGFGLTDAQADPILRAGEQPQTITALQVEYVRTRM